MKGTLHLKKPTAKVLDFHALKGFYLKRDRQVLDFKIDREEIEGTFIHILEGGFPL